jgi:hypothetical protein
MPGVGRTVRMVLEGIIPVNEGMTTLQLARLGTGYQYHSKGPGPMELIKKDNESKK